jgi:hypothetical protein
MILSTSCRRTERIARADINAGLSGSAHTPTHDDFYGFTSLF